MTPILVIGDALKTLCQGALPGVAIEPNLNKALASLVARAVVIRPLGAAPLGNQVLGLLRVNQVLEIVVIARGGNPLTEVETMDAAIYAALLANPQLSGLTEQINWQGEAWDYDIASDADYSMKTVRWQLIYRQRETERILA